MTFFVLLGWLELLLLIGLSPIYPGCQERQAFHRLGEVGNLSHLDDGLANGTSRTAWCVLGSN